MLFVIILAIIAVVGGVITIATNVTRYSGIGIVNTLSAVANVVTMAAIVTWVMYMLIAFANNFEAEDTFIRFSEKYESCMYRLEHNPNDSDYIEYSLLHDIVEYNKNVLRGRKWQDNKWFGAAWPDIYNELDLIELPK